MKIMAQLIMTVLFLFCVASSGFAVGEAGSGPASVSPQMHDLQEKMLSDEGTMALIKSLQDDPEIRALLADPKVLEAVQAGDIGALLNNPRVLKLLDKPQVREIEKRIEKYDGGEGE